jgi:hypothetical protein
MHESFQGHIQEQVQAQLQQLLAQQGNALVLHNPGGHRSSCTSATAIENDENHYPIDDLEESKYCWLVTPILGIPGTVAFGWPDLWLKGLSSILIQYQSKGICYSTCRQGKT